jgi:hypothetical protein
MVEMEVELRTLTGSHITPLTQNIILDRPPQELNLPFVLPDIIFSNPVRTKLEENFLATINDVKKEILSWLEVSVQTPKI